MMSHGNFLLWCAVFGVPKPGYYRIYYIMNDPRDLETALSQADPVHTYSQFQV
jgi:hypothetical protein